MRGWSRAITQAVWRNRLAPCAIAGCLFAAVAIASNTAAAQTTTGQNLANDSGALDFFRPPPNLFQMTDSYRTAPGSTREVTTETLDLRYDHAFNLQSGWMLATRSDLPLLAKNPISDLNPAGEYVRGIGDADIQAALIHDINQRWAFGFGMRLVAPTGDELLGSGKWQLMPIVGARLALPEITSGSYFEPLLRYDVSVAGDPTKKNISNLQFAPMLNIGLPDKWYVTLFPSTDIRINYGDPITGQTGRWFVPFDFRFGKKFTENIALSLEVGVPIIRDYPVYNFKTQLRLNVTY
jgi:Putative MetA-pathway of phenol degradation